MKRSWRFDKTDVLILALTAFFFIAIAWKMPVQIYGDGDFHRETKNFSLFLHGAATWNDIHISKAPGPDFYYLIPYSLVKAGAKDKTYWLAAVIWTALFMFICMCMLRRVADLLFGPPAGKMVIFLSFIIPLHVYYGLGIRAEALVYISIVFLLYGWVMWKAGNYSTFYRSRHWWLMCMGLLFMVLARPNAIFIVPILVLLLLASNFISWKDSASKAGTWAALGVFCVCFFAITAFVKSLAPPLNTHNQADYFLHVAHQGRFQFRNEPFDWRYWDSDVRSDSRDYNDWKASDSTLEEEIKASHKTYGEVYKEWLVNDIKSHPVLSVRQFILKAIYGHILDINSIQNLKFHIGPFKGKTILNGFIYLLNIINFLFVIAAIYWMISRRRLMAEYWPLWAPWLALLLFNSLIYMEPRYMFPVRPEMLLLASSLAVVLGRKLFPKLFAPRLT